MMRQDTRPWLLYSIKANAARKDWSLKTCESRAFGNSLITPEGPYFTGLYDK
jgi:hypothetical protein